MASADLNLFLLMIIVLLILLVFTLCFFTFKSRRNEQTLAQQLVQQAASLKDAIEQQQNARQSADVLIESLQYTANFNQNIIQSTHDTLLVLSTEGQIKSVNNASLDLLGYEEKELKGRSIRQLIAPHDRDKLFDGEQLITKFKDGCVRGLDIDYTNKQGDDICMLFSSSAMHDDKGKLLGIVCTALDMTGRNRTERELKDNRECLKAIIDNTVDAIITIDQQGLIETFNLAAERIFGYRSTEVVGKNVSMLMPAPHSQLHDEYLQNYLEIGESEIIGVGRELEGKCKDGSLFPMELAVSAVILADRQIFTGIIRDLRRSKAAEKAAYQSGKTLDSIFLNLPMGIAILEGPQFRYLRINKTLADLHGLPIGNHLGKPLAEVIPNAERDIIPELTAVLASGQPILQRESKVLLPGQSDKSICVLDWHIPVKDLDNEITSIVSVVMDISQLKQAEDELRLRVKFERLISEVSSGLVALSMDELDQGIDQLLATIGAFCGVDRTFVLQLDQDEKLINNSYEWCAKGAESQQARWHNLVLDEQLPWFAQHVREHQVFDVPDVSRLPPEALQESAFFSTGGVRSLLVVPMVVGQRIVGLIGVETQRMSQRWSQDDRYMLRIVGEMLAHSLQHRQAEQTIRRIQKLDAIGQLTGGIAHDFNNILGVIMGNIELLEREFQDNTKALGRLASAQKAAQRAATLTKQLLGVARREATTVDTVNVNDIITEMGELIHNSLGEQVNVAQQLEPQLWLTDIDPGDLQDALLNLMINARDAMPDGGQLTLQTSNQILDHDYCRLNPEATEGSYVQIMVADAGTGILPEHQQRIFEPFFTTKSQGKGTGLGLAMVFGFVKRSKGYIKVYSEIDLGTTFRLYLPRALSEKKQREHPPVFRTAELPHGDETLLVVDDERGLLDLVEYNLTKLGYKVITANNGAEALVRLQKGAKVSLLISDVVMPGGVDGYQLATQGRAANADLKILLTSGFTEKSHVTSDKMLDVDFLDKPYSQAELALLIRQILDRV